VFSSIIIGIFLVFLFKNKPDNQKVKPLVVVKANDSLVFKQLRRIKSYKKADSLYYADAYDSAIYYFNKTFLEFTLPKDVKCRQEIFNRIGYTYVLLNDYKKARHFLGKAQTYLLGKDSMLVDANTLDYLGVLNRYMNEFDSALNYLNKSYKIYVRIIGDKNLQVVKLNIHIGNVYRWIRSDYYNAEKYYYKALQIYESQRFNKKDELYFNMLYNLASTNRLKMDYNKSLSYGLQALQVASTIENNKKHSEICYALVANIYYALNDYKQAIDYYNKALEINSKTSGINNKLRGLYLHSLALANYKLNNFTNTILYCNKALKILYKITPNYDVISNCYAYLGLSYREIHQWPKALENLKRNLVIKQKCFGAKHPNTAYAYYLLGKYYAAKQNLDSALYYNQLAIISGAAGFNNITISANPLVSESLENSSLIDFLNQKASTLKDKYTSNPDDITSLKVSLKSYELLDSLVSYSRKSMDTEKSKLSFSISRNETYEDAIDCAFQLFQWNREKKYIRKAFHFFERNKHLLLLEKLKVAEAANKAMIPDSLAEAERNLSAELKLAQDKLAKEQSKKDVEKNSILIQSLNDRIFSLVREIEKLSSVLERKFPNYYKIKYQDAVVQLDTLQKYARDKNVGIIQYFWGEKSVYIISISGDLLNFCKINNNQELKDNLTRSITLMHEVNFSSKENFKEYYTKSQHLYETLIKPLLPAINPKESGFQNLVIIPDGMLTKLSFEGLVIAPPKSAKFSFKNLEYLIYRYNIQYAYSSNILVSNENSERQRSVNKLLGFGYAGEESSVNKGSGNKGLPGTVAEMKAVSKYFRSKVFLGQNASESNFKKNISDYNIVHLALHGMADEENESGSRLIFRTEKDKVEDGMLHANEIYNLKLNAKLVVLSACETGIGKNYQGEGVFSMSRAFSYAGCPSIVISLWNVNDKSTAELMGHFYNQLSKGEEIGKALHKAKIEFLENSDEIGCQPVFWASFVAFGDMSPIKSGSNYPKWLIFLIIVAGSFLIYWFVIRKAQHRRIIKT